MNAPVDLNPAMSEPFAKPRTLLLLTNQELWPGIICTRHFRPEKIILLHGNTPAASKEPAVRLQKFLLKSGLVDKCELLELSDDDFVGIQQKLDSASTTEPLAVGFNGATKLMAVACFDWAMKKGHQALYLETDNEIQRFEADGDKIVCRREDADLSGLSNLNPVETMRSHLQRSEIRKTPKVLTLSEQGKDLPMREALEMLDQSLRTSKRSQVPLLCRDNRPWHPDSGTIHSYGERYELTVALALLKLGVAQVAHSVELSAFDSQHVKHVHAELDLVFIWKGRLWVVECKDHEKVEKKGRKLWDSLKQEARLHNLDSDEQEFIDEMGGMLRRRYKKILKERMLAARECGGALAQVIFAVRDEPGGDVAEFAELHKIHMARQNSLEQDLAQALSVKIGRESGSWLDLLSDGT